MPGAKRPGRPRGKGKTERAGSDDAPVLRRRLADVLKLVGQQVGASEPPAAVGAGLSPRMRQTLQRLLAGDSEKQIAARLELSPHTVHVYVKAIYKYFCVCTRAELLAKFVRTQ